MSCDERRLVSSIYRLRRTGCLRAAHSSAALQVGRMAPMIDVRTLSDDELREAIVEAGRRFGAAEVARSWGAKRIWNELM